MFCSKCGTQLEDTTKFCSSCGKGVEEPAKADPTPPSPEEKPNLFQKINDTPESTAEYDPTDIAQNKGMAVLSYLGILVLIPWFAAEKSKFARFHAKQGITLLLLDIAYGIVSFLLRLIKTTHYIWGVPYRATPGIIVFLIWLIGIPLIVLSIIGIVNAVQGKAKELPIIGKLKFIK
ncbi:MAG TPA: zinc-ribbon domain-containing protein [Clostridiales bacterium]|jgi:uncharacterized membrane protein|nr:zinc-ribbon domain-containing protein [Clostridiales bacterium]